MSSATKTYHGKCSYCCPDGGACFKLDYDYDMKTDVLKCTNCGRTKTLRKINRKPDGPNERQKNLIDHITELGWEVETTMIGRKVWISAKHPTKNWVSGNSVFGTLGPNGKIDLKLQGFGKPIEIKDGFDVNSWL